MTNETLCIFSIPIRPTACHKLQYIAYARAVRHMAAFLNEANLLHDARIFEWNFTPDGYLTIRLLAIG